MVLALLILILGPLAALRTPTDIFPDIRIPGDRGVWQYTGLSPDDMAGPHRRRRSERALTTTVNDIEHIEAQSYNGVGIVKIFFQPGANIRTANAQVTAISQTVLKQMPPGTTPPLILNYNASTVPILQLALSGDSALASSSSSTSASTSCARRWSTVPGAAMPWPYGGKLRQVQIDLDPVALQARGLSGQDVANALAAQNLITPVGTQKIGAVRIRRSSSTTRRRGSPISATCRSRPSTARWSTCATSPRCATAIRRRPTSCTSTATARC